MEIISVDKNNISLVTKFLKSLEIIKDINEDVVMNGEYVYDEEIIGFLTYEEFNKIGLIRYFVFKKQVEKQIINELFAMVASKAKLKGIQIFITLVVKDEAIEIFKRLGFAATKSEDIFIEELNIRETRFKDAIVLKYELN